MWCHEDMALSRYTLDKLASTPVGNGKDSLVWSYLSLGNVVSQSLSNLVRKVYVLRLASTFRFMDENLSSLNILRPQAQDFPNPHSGDGLQLDDQSVPKGRGAVYEFINGFFFQNTWRARTMCLEGFRV